LEAAAFDTIPAAQEYTSTWSPPEDLERWHCVERLLRHQADLQRLRAVRHGRYVVF
jgi:hypothetical protein